MSHQAIIKVEGLSKHYLLNKNPMQKSDTLYGNFINGLKNIKQVTQKKQTEDFWALKDVSFEIQQGDRVGIIGRNGAGKSTLLKILSRITPPTKGRIEYSGRMASLLEVGTGFHGDLSGRENIYLNGSILGMTKQEIDRKFDEIVAFAEVEKFLDTPVKRYSSGMYVRLAFAVAANLESDILIVDEVLAVGDAAFQKKCLGKMNEVSKADGRTILFVSHNMGQVASLCNTGILLNKGQIEEQGSISSIINRYYKENSLKANVMFNFEDNSLKELYVKSISICNQLHEATLNFAHNEPIVINIEVKTNSILNDVILGVIVYDSSEKRIFTTQLPIGDKVKQSETTIFKLKIPDTFLIPNSYNFTIGIHIPNIQVIDELLNIGKFEVFDNGSEFYKYQNSDVGVVFANCDWKY
jgi:lipopolysaccharide transport system ATP-binding protein